MNKCFLAKPIMQNLIKVQIDMNEILMVKLTMAELN
jgi:hypothetical protein